MPKKKSRRNQSQPQIFDPSMKELVEQQAPQILSYFLQGAIYQETLDIEIIRPTMRADRVYKVIYRGELHILHLEFQVSEDTELPARLLVYSSVLYQKYKLPVISIIIYPFKTTIAKPPLRVLSGGKAIMTLDYRTLLLFEENATKYIQEHAISMYPLLPTMKHVDTQLIQQAIEEMQSYYREQYTILSQHYTWMCIFLDGSDTITPEEKLKIKGVLNMLDSLWNKNPRVQQEKAKALEEGRAEGLSKGLAEGLSKGLAEGLAEGEARGQLETSRTFLLTVINARFPALTELAQQKIASMTQPEKLRVLVEQIAVASNEEAARWLLSQESSQ